MSRPAAAAERRRAVSVSLGSKVRDERAILELGGAQVEIERRGTDGDTRAAGAQFEELDGQVDALGLGGFELHIRIDRRRYPLHAGLRLIRGVRRTPVVDGGGLKQTLERRVFELAAARMGGPPAYRNALVIAGVDRFGLARAVTDVSNRVTFADLPYGLGLPIPLRSLATVRRAARLLLPIVGRFPISWLYPTGADQSVETGKYPELWRDVDLVAGDFHYIRTNMPGHLRGCTVVTNTTTPADIELLGARGVKWLITTTPRIDGRSFGTNMLEAALTAWAGSARELAVDELNALIDRFHLCPTVMRLDG